MYENDIHHIEDALRERVAWLERENADWLKAIAFLRQTKADLTAENEALRERIEPYITMMDADDIVWFCEHGCADPNG